MHLKPGSNIKALNLAYGLVTLDQGQGVDFLEVFLFVVCVVVLQEWVCGAVCVCVCVCV